MGSEDPCGLCALERSKAIAERDAARSEVAAVRKAVAAKEGESTEDAARTFGERSRDRKEALDKANAELREIREAIGADPEESTADEVRRLVHAAEALRTATRDRVTLTVAREPLSRDARTLLALRILASWAADDESGEDQPGVEPAMEWADKRGAAMIAKALGIEEDKP